MRTTSMVVLLLVLLIPSAVPAQDRTISKDDIKKLAQILEEGAGYKARVHAARAMGMLRSADALPYLIRGLKKDSDQLVRAACAWSLGSINHPGAIAVLADAKTNDVTLVQTQAERALNYLLSSFPGNLSAAAGSLYRISIDDLKDPVTRDGELTKWIQQYFLDRMIKYDDIEVGEEMDIEEEGEAPIVPESFKPEIRFTLHGGIEKIDAPKGRAAGDITITMKYKVVLQPVEVHAFSGKGYKGSARFSGEPAPTDPWADDPLVEAQKRALNDAAGAGFADLAKFLRLKTR